MFIRRNTPSMYVTLGYILGIATILVVNRYFDYPLVCGRAWSSTSDKDRRSVDEPEHAIVDRTVRPEADQRKGGVNQSIVNASLITIEDEQERYQSVKQDALSVARKLRHQVRVLCWIMTCPSRLDSRARHVLDTWGKRCSVLLFASDYMNKTFPTINITVPPGRDHLTMKTRLAFDYIAEHHRDDADWFLKADDDTYVIMENLRYMLAPYSPQEAIYFGHAFYTGPPKTYFSGGSGYVMSREALNRWSRRPAGRCREDGGSEDLEMGRCLRMLKVKAGDSRDFLGRHRFNPANLHLILTGRVNDWIRNHTKYGEKQGADSISDYPVSFHYVHGAKMNEIDYLVYRAHAYGIVGGLDPVNLHESTQQQQQLSASSESRQRQKRGQH